jgi:WD40 repeat protein
LWRIADGKETASLAGHRDLILDLHFSPDGQMLMSAAKDETARLWQVMTKDLPPVPVASR